MIFETKVEKVKYRSKLTIRTKFVGVYGRVPQTSGCRGEY
jgi:hypothetical protein